MNRTWYFDTLCVKEDHDCHELHIIFLMCRVSRSRRLLTNELLLVKPDISYYSNKVKFMKMPFVLTISLANRTPSTCILYMKYVACDLST